jgi:ADP-ribose pyrophosphatase
MQLAHRRIYTGRVVHLDVDSVQYPDGSTGEMEMLRHPGAAAVIPFASDPRGADPTLLLIRQYRYATGGPLFEIPAGRLDAGEAPEEVGVTAGRLERLTTIWTTPGFTDERIHLFWAADLAAGAHAREPDEFIEVVPKPLSEVLAMVRSGEICDGKTVVAILYMAGFILGI